MPARAIHYVLLLEELLTGIHAGLVYASVW